MGTAEIGTAAEVGLATLADVDDGTLVLVLAVLLAVWVTTELTAPVVVPTCTTGTDILVPFPGSTDVTTRAVVRVNGYVRVAVVLDGAVCKVVETVGVGVVDGDGAEGETGVVRVTTEE